MLNLFTQSASPIVHSFCFTLAIVLRSWPFGESDKIVSFLTEGYGKLNGIAKGAKRSRKRFVNTLEPFSLVSLTFKDRSHGTLAFIHACDLVRPFRNLTTSLEKIAYASYILEITEGLTAERDQNDALFEHLRSALIFLEEKEPSLWFLTFFELRLLGLSGYQPALQDCRRCGRSWSSDFQKKWCFSPRDGGILCESCSSIRKEVIPLSFDALRALANLQAAHNFCSHQPPLPSVALKEVRFVLLRFVQFLMNRELKSAPFLDAFSFA